MSSQTSALAKLILFRSNSFLQAAFFGCLYFFFPNLLQPLHEKQMILSGLFVLFLLQITSAMNLSHAGLQTMTFISFSPHYWLQYASLVTLEHQFLPVFCFGSSACFSERAG